MTINIPYGHSDLKILLPENRVLGILQNKVSAPNSMNKMLLKALRHEKFPFRKKKALIIVPDTTRSAHLRDILPVLLEKISVPSRSVDIIIATGMHKRHTHEQVEKLLGSAALKQCRVIHHDPYGKSIVNFGKTKYGVPAALNKAVIEHDLLISIGIIEPHLYAGYSGGAKTIAIGLAGEETINATHSIKFLDNPAVGIGSLKENPFQETLWHIVDNIAPVYSINTVNDADGKALKVFAGNVKDVFKKGTDAAKDVFEIKVKTEADIVICGIGYPKDINLYQASRAINYIASVDKPVIRKGGVIIVAAELKDGVGESFAEKRFYDELKGMRSPKDFVSRVSIEGCVAGEHRAYMVAKVLSDYNVIFVGKEHKGFMEGLPFKYFGNMPDAVSFAGNITGKDPKIYIVPRALATIAKCERHTSDSA